MASSDFAILMRDQVNEHFGLEYDRYPAIYPKIYDVNNIKTRDYIMQGWVGRGLPQERKPGRPVQYSAIRPDFGIRFIVAGYSLGDVVAEEDIMDDVFGMLTKWVSTRSGEWAISYSTLEERLAAYYLYNTAWSAASPVPQSPDGDSLFSTTHPMSAQDTATTWGNRPTSEVDLSMAAIQAARANLAQQPAPNGVTLMRNKIKQIIVNDNIAEIAYQLQKGEWTPNTASRNMNTMRGQFEVITWPYFRLSGAASATAYNGWIAQGEQSHLHWFDREQVVFDSDKDVTTRSVVITSHRRMTLGHSSARGVFGSKGT